MNDKLFSAAHDVLMEWAVCRHDLPEDLSRKLAPKMYALNTAVEEEMHGGIGFTDLRISVMQPYGFGGPDTKGKGVFIEHIPSGLQVICDSERTVHMNRAKGLIQMKQLLRERSK